MHHSYYDVEAFTQLTFCEFEHFAHARMAYATGHAEPLQSVALVSMDCAFSPGGSLPICCGMAAQHQHYVPQLLLRGFLSRDPEKAAKEQVHVLDLQKGQTFTPSIGNIMGERRFNDFWLDDDTLASIEPAAGRIESHIAPLVERIRAERRLERSPEEFGDLALLMAFQLIRTKKMRLFPERVRQQLTEHVKRMGFDPAKVDGLEVLDEKALKRLHVRNQIEGLAKYTALIAEKELFLMSAPEGSTFYLGDHPVVLHNDEERRGMFGRLGLAVPYIQIYLPLSSDLTLCAYDKAVLGQLMKVRDDGVRENQVHAVGKLIRGEITGPQMKAALDAMKAFDVTTPLIDTIRAGEPVAVGSEQVQCYNSLQAFHAHRFVVDPDGIFEVATEMMAERHEAAPEEPAPTAEGAMPQADPFGGTGAA